MTASRVPSTAEIREYLRPFDFFERYAHGSREGEVYVDAHARRFEETLRRLAHLPPGTRVLELGAVPYYMTVLLCKFLGFEVDTLSFYEVERASASVHEIENTRTGERFAFPHRPINIERDRFPFPDARYDVVLCCEVLEHLLINPSQMLYEAHRVLAPDGCLLVTTPNVARWQNVMALAAGGNVYDRYHGNGIYGRHNREWTLPEVTRLLTACGFVVDRAETCDVYPSPFAPGQQPAIGGREDNIFVLGRASAPRRLACPDSLYVLMDEYRNVLYPYVLMGVNDIGHLGRGWYELEWDGERGCRWTGGAADLSLRHDGAGTLQLDICAHHPDLAESPVAVAVSSAGTDIGQAVIGAYGWTTVAVPVPAPAGGISTFQLKPSRTWSPAAHGETDTRVLGIRVSAARIA